MPRALKGRMPRVLPDHRSALGKHLRCVYEDIGTRYELGDGIARRVAIMAARSWLEYENVSQEVAALTAKRPRGKISMALTRSRRRQASYAGQFLGGLRTLQGLAEGNGKSVEFHELLRGDT